MQENYIRQTFQLAQRGGHQTYPNPLVGAIVVKGGKIIGRGYHKKFGTDHAEVAALKNCRTSPRGATLYVNLEPCCHHGKTPACTDAIIKAGIKKVVFSNLDPFSKVKGRGKKILQKNRIRVETGCLKPEGAKLNEIYFHYQKTGLPFVALKIATSLDGKVATHTGDSKWITNPEARAYGRQLRGRYQAILVGANTVRQDNPHLGIRQTGQPDPLRVILGGGKLSKKYRVFRDKNYLQITGQKPLRSTLKSLARKGIISIFVEGGPTTIAAFVDAGLAQKIYWFQAPLIVGGKRSLGAVPSADIGAIGKALKLRNVERQVFADNELITGYF